MIDPTIETVLLDDGMRVLAVAGDLDLATVPRLERRLLAALDGGAASVIIDLTNCEFLDSSALAALLRAKKRLDGADRQLSLVVTHPIVLRSFEITHLDRLFEIHPTRAAAVSGRRETSPFS